MYSEFENQVDRYAEVIVRIGLNLQRGQRLLMAEPYDLQGINPESDPLIAAIRRVAGCPCEVIKSSAEQVRHYAAKADWRGWSRLVATNAEKIADHARNGDALLFLPSSHPGLLAGLPTPSITELRKISWEYFGPVAQDLMTGITNWTAAPAPSIQWADAVHAELPKAARLPALWQTIFTACRVNSPDPVAVWRAHLSGLLKRRDELNGFKLTSLRYLGTGTDLTVQLPPEHRWCTASLTTKSGIPYVANLPTEEIFTLPHRDTAEGTVTVARPIHYAGALIDGITLRFEHGRVVEAASKTGHDLLEQLLAIDDGATRLGEVAMVSATPEYAGQHRFFHHPLLDENASPHLALGEGYGFCLRRPNPPAYNRSLIHVDLSLDARLILPGKEPS